jgi:hypothetical protein
VLGGVILVLALVAPGYTTSLRAVRQRTADWAERQKSAERMAAEIDVHLEDMDERTVRVWRSPAARNPVIIRTIVVL